jgi:proliferating cell nuclear antigen
MEILIKNPTNSEIFTTLFQHMKLFTENLNVYFHEDKVFIQGMDHAHVSIFEINLPKLWFDEYKLETGITIGINTNMLFKVLNTRDKSHNIHLILNDENSDKLEIHLLSENNNVMNLNYVIPLIDIDSEIMSIPDTEYQAEISLPSTTFSTLIDQMKLFGETFNIICNEEKVQMNSESIDCGKMYVDIPIDDLNSYAIEEDETLNLSYSISHLKNICFYSKISKDIDIYLKKDFPIKLVYSLNSEEAHATFYLAPKIDD